MRKLVLALFFAVVTSFSASAAADGATSDLGGDLCPDAQVFNRLFDKFCWSCLLPIRLAGIGGNPPEGAAKGKPFCACMDNNGVPEIGMPVGFFMPFRMLEFSPVPYCMPSMGVKLTDDYSRLGQVRAADPIDKTEKSFLHYKYWIFPLMFMLNMFTNADCMFDPFQTMDLAYFSESDPLYQDDMLAFLLAPETVVFANPVATSICAADCANIIAGGEVEFNYWCAGCQGNLYPMTGNAIYNDDPLGVTSLLTTRILAGLHRKGLALETMGNDMISGTCEPEYVPMLPKTQYRASMIYPVAEANGSSSDGMGQEKDPDGGQAPGESIVPIKDCCHKLGQSTLRWGLGRNTPGKEHHIYMLYRWTDCCVR
ncbi:TraU family protein [Enterovibrio norvegicus]|uniref:TraU family protein n=1 Tax=Enterovibrio norvegicus TaxID=188144 RepID=UPI00352F1204